MLACAAGLSPASQMMKPPYPPAPSVTTSQKSGESGSPASSGDDARDSSRLRIITAGASADPRLVEECRHIARRLRREQIKALGLYPVNDESAALPAAAHIGVALGEQSSAPVALVDVNARWRTGSAPAAASGTLGSLLRTRWLAGDRLALLALPEGASIGAGLLELGRLLSSGRAMFENILIDMTGLERLGEHLAAATLCDALLLVARAGRTKEEHLERARVTFAAHRVLGVILTGAPS